MAGAPPRDLADALAELKALKVSALAPDALVLGSDSLVALADGTILDKPRDRADAAAHLRALSGGRHDIVSAAVLAQGGRVVWRQVDVARLHVRPLSDAFIAGYLDAEWPAIAGCVGCFRIEGPGRAVVRTDRRRSFHRAGHAAAAGARAIARAGGAAVVTAPYAEVIGDPIAHSKSPLIHGFWLDALGIAGEYRATQVSEAQLPDFIAGRRADPDWRGCNVTIPHKVAVTDAGR